MQAFVDSRTINGGAFFALSQKRYAGGFNGTFESALFIPQASSVAREGGARADRVEGDASCGGGTGSCGRGTIEISRACPQGI